MALLILNFTNVSNFLITSNYKSKILKAYFEELQPDYGIHFVEEQEQLGTAGGLRFLAASTVATTTNPTAIMQATEASHGCRPLP